MIQQTKYVTVWYDSQCPLCAREIALMRRLDRRGAIEFVDAFPLTATGKVSKPTLRQQFADYELPN